MLIQPSAEQIQLNKQQIWCGEAYPDCYLNLSHSQLITNNLGQISEK